MLGIIITIVVAGVLLWLVTTYVPMDPNIKKLLVAVVVICLVLYVLNAFGAFSYLPGPRPFAGPCR
jgi:uncharacterized membrane protein YvlD (DUF360 family)